MCCVLFVLPSQWPFKDVHQQLPSTAGMLLPVPHCLTCPEMILCLGSHKQTPGCHVQEVFLHHVHSLPHTIRLPPLPRAPQGPKPIGKGVQAAIKDRFPEIKEVILIE